MDRSLSIDDFANAWRLGHAGLGRNDSETHFADLLKSFPSTNSLTGDGVSNGQNNEQQQQPGDPDAAQPQQAGAGQASGTGPNATPQRHGGVVSEPMAGMGMPRVASLEFLKQFLPQQLGQTTPGGKKEPGALPFSASLPAQSHPQMDLSALPNVLNANSLAALSAMPGLQAASVNQNALLAAGLTPAAAAAALQLSGLSPQIIDRETLEKAEQRRTRRMLSNRESARRSRRRKQEHLTNMEHEISELAEDKRKWTELRESLERRCEAAEEESRKLREENQRLREELGILDLVKEELAEQRRCLLKRDHDAHKDQDEKPNEKRQKKNGDVLHKN